MRKKLLKKNDLCLYCRNKSRFLLGRVNMALINSSASRSVMQTILLKMESVFINPVIKSANRLLFFTGEVLFQ